MANILFIGLGNMGYPIAGHLSRAGNKVTVYNRSPARADAWTEEFRGHKTNSLQLTNTDFDAVCLCVGRDDDVRDILTGSHKLLNQLTKTTLIIDHTTTSATLAAEMAEACTHLGLRFADAPVSGGQQGALNGQLSLMVGAAAADFDEIKALTSPYTRAIEHMGPVGSGQKAKMVNQICVAGLIESLAEGMFFAQKAGLDVQQVMRVISQGAAGSWQMQNRYQSMLANHYQHGFAVNWMHKDLQICLSEAKQMGITLPVTHMVDDYYSELQSMGAGTLDTSSLLLRLQKKDENQAG